MKKQHVMLGLLASLCISSAFASTASTSGEYNIANGLLPIEKDQSISVLQPFQGNFRILGSKIYNNDEQAKFSPIDYAVSWGLFAQPDIARTISVKQYDRYLNWKMSKLPVPAEQAMQMVSNMHIIPASPQIAQQIKQVKRGDLVYLKGDLVEIKDKNLVWRSSLTSTDTGDGACELFRVQSIHWVEKQNI
ncbi:hypothetical protein [Acinetobacter nosocomialis]|uniref:hypothetical protein n=1 Tax=Acinetobacter nosocomialis TaxID=106654 RepID=UPI000DA9349B|nr:hypothetical protein [Acinetobacter nosocomialis]PZL95196.1 hypothetical protein DOL92_18285 [Acinetobacter nosocomialis]